MQEITNRIGVHKVGLTILQEFKWLEREQSISDYGIDMQIEIVNDEKPTGQLIAIQIKSGESYFKETTESSIVFRGEKKHLNYWQFHSIPVLIFLYHPIEDKIYWEKILTKNTVETEKGWKVNIPKTNILTADSKKEIEKYYYNRNHFVTIELSDNSHGLARRISAKILVDKGAISRSSMERMIPFLIDDFKNSDYYGSKMTKAKYYDSPADIVFLFFYNDIQQVKRGLPFCRAFWNSESCEYKVEISNPDWEKDGIQIEWGKNYTLISDMINENQMSKGEFIEIANKSFEVSNEIYDGIKRVYDNLGKSASMEDLEKEVIRHEEKINTIYAAINFKDKFTPLECTDLNSLITNFVVYLSNVLLVVKDHKRDDRNKKFMINSALNDCHENLKYYNYELRKIK